MTPRQVRSLLAVHHHKSVNKAAKILHLAPSSVSAQLKELASELKVELFTAQGRNIVLSDIGKALLPKLQAFVGQEEAVKQQAQALSSELTGTITLFAPSSMCIYRLPVIIERLQKIAPNVELLLTHEPFDYEQALKLGEIDAAIVVTDADNLSSASVTTAVNVWQEYILHKEEVIYVAHPQLHRGELLSLEELAKSTIIATEPECTYRLRADKHFADYGMVFSCKQSFSNAEVVKRCIMAEMGVGLLPRCVVDAELHAGVLIEQAVIGTPYVFYSRLIHLKDKPISAKLAALIQASVET
ncbi:MAG: DNA-binding transcriptional LysR family regulator [Candidatus Endobugula sp.]|jgi:DNA-binding transcriptional LysR family regulator